MIVAPASAALELLPEAEMLPEEVTLSEDDTLSEVVAHCPTQEAPLLLELELVSTCVADPDEVSVATPPASAPRVSAMPPQPVAISRSADDTNAPRFIGQILSSGTTRRR
jgi:hypothetical protein